MGSDVEVLREGPQTPREAAEELADDEALAPVVSEHRPLALDPAEDIFARLVTAICRQQVSMSAADAIERRLTETFAVTPEAMLAADVDALTQVGLSAAKVEYVKSAAQAFQTNGYDRSYFAGMATTAVLDELGAIRGVGPWTAKMFCLFCLGRTDVFPVEDLGVRKGMEVVLDVELTRQEMTERAADWRPYRSYAALYLWRAYES